MMYTVHGFQINCHILLFFLRYMLGLAGLPSLIQAIGFIFLPESPRYVVKRGDDERAREILRKVRGTNNVEHELQDIKNTCKEDQANDGIYFKC